MAKVKLAIVIMDISERGEGGRA